jgi:hypothetical protein
MRTVEPDPGSVLLDQFAGLDHVASVPPSHEFEGPADAAADTGPAAHRLVTLATPIAIAAEQNRRPLRMHFIPAFPRTWQTPLVACRVREVAPRTAVRSRKFRNILHDLCGVQTLVSAGRRSVPASIEVPPGARRRTPGEIPSMWRHGTLLGQGIFG